MLNKRYVAHLVIEAKSPLKIGGNDIDMLQDSPIQKDWNGLPMILGTSIAGVLRKSFDKVQANEIFGDEESRKKDAKGSRVVISNALLCDENMQVHETLVLRESVFLQTYENLPVREHVKITSKGVADVKQQGKFDEEVVFKGSRFVFRMELLSDREGDSAWDSLLEKLQTESFRLGGGSTKGFGEISIVKEHSNYALYDVTQKEYADKSASLNTLYAEALPVKTCNDERYYRYSLQIEPDDFFRFGSGFGDDDADDIPVTEKTVVWENGKGSFSNEHILMPASSLKGALAHRAVYHYNLTKGNYAGEGDAVENLSSIFGEKKEDEIHSGAKGRLLLSDVYQADRNESKLFDHVSIDRFTGGGIDSALFNEKTVAQKEKWQIEILLEKDVDTMQREAFESALKDLCSGMLPLGGATTKGHGVFTGSLKRDNEVLYEGGAE